MCEPAGGCGGDLLERVGLAYTIYNYLEPAAERVPVWAVLTGLVGDPRHSPINCPSKHVCASGQTTRRKVYV